MFSYYGSKSKIVHLYPKPKHSRIVEPFAGSARYALRYFDRDVILIDKYKVIIDIWKYLQNASEKDVLSLPDAKHADLRDFNLTDAERYLIYFCATSGGGARTGYTVRDCNQNMWRQMKPQIAKNLWKIRHWKLVHGEYNCVETEATWFIDPPYFEGGHKYKHSNKKINFAKISDFAESRKGQVIVCENSSANWMPFQRLAKMTGCFKTTTEVFWTNEKVETQPTLFENIESQPEQKILF